MTREKTYFDESQVRDHRLDLADDLGLRGRLEGVELHVEDGLLLGLLLQREPLGQQRTL